VPESQITKRILAQSIKELMQKTPLSKISVGDISEHCGVNRNTFYYHFRDKYELINWIYYTETLEQMNAFSDPEHWEEGLCNLCLYMQRNKEFYINAIGCLGQNSFAEYLRNFYFNLLITCIEELKGDFPMEKEDTALMARFFTYAFVGLILEWAENGMKDDPVAYANRLKGIFDGILNDKIKLTLKGDKESRGI